MIIKILRPIILCGEPTDTDEIVDAPDADALRVVGMGAAERYTEPVEPVAPPVVVTAPGTIKNDDPKPVNSDPKP